MPLPVRKTKLISLKKNSTGVFFNTTRHLFQKKYLIKEAPNLFMRQYPSTRLFQVIIS